MVGDIRGPFGDQFFETARTAGEQRTGRLLEMRPVAGHYGHEAVGRFLPEADTLRVLVHAPRFVDKFSVRDRGPAFLLRQPIPVPRQQRDFARDHAEFRAAWTAWCGDRGIFVRRRRCGRRNSRQDVVDRTAKVDIDRRAGSAFENQDRGVLTPVERFPRGARDVAETSRSNTSVSLEGDIGKVSGGVDEKSHTLEYITPGN